MMVVLNCNIIHANISPIFKSVFTMILCIAPYIFNFFRILHNFLTVCFIYDYDTVTRGGIKMKKAIVFGSMLACFLMLMIPNVSAFEYQTVVDSKVPVYYPDLNEEELKDAILERIEQLQEQKKDISILGLNWTDPDGPLEGGLDDISDIGNLLIGIFASGLVLSMIIYGGIRNAPTIYELVGWIILYGVNIGNALVCFGEAFDVIEVPPGDGR